MGKIRRFLGFLVFSCVVAFTATTAAFAEEVTLHWDSPYGTSPADTTCTYGETFDVPAGPVVEGRNFVSWTVNGQAFLPGETNVPCTVEILGLYGGVATFTGSFTPVNYTITYVLNGGTNSGFEKYNYNIDSPDIELYAATRMYSNFWGWYYTPDFSGSEVEKIPTGSTGNKTLYASWTCKSHYNDNDNDNVCSLNTYTVTYSCGDGSGTPPAQATATYGQTFVTAQNTCTKADSQFDGWLVSGTSDDPKTAGAGFTWTYTTNKTLTAKWVQHPGNCTVGQYYDASTTSCKSCPAGYTSALGADDASECYTTCETTCVNPPNSGNKNCNYGEGINTCVYDPTTIVPGIMYNTPGATCQSDRICDFESIGCKVNYYFDGDLSYYNANGEENTDNICKKCSIETGGAYNLSIVNENNGIHSCYTEAVYDCTQELPSLTPALATCTLPGDGTINGVVYYDNPKNDPTYIKPRPNTSCYVESCTCPFGYTYNEFVRSCDPNVYTITLDDSAGSGDVRKIYEKYTYGFTNDPYDDTIITTVTNLPTRVNWVFWGYWDAPTGGTMYIDRYGNLPSSAYAFTQDKVLYAHWVHGIYECVAGYAADKTTPCAAGYYCPGGGVPEGDEESAEIGCQRLCPTHPDGDPVTSPASSNDISACYSTTTGVDLANGTGGGDLVCNYLFDDLTDTGEYSTCAPINIKYCSAGYYYDSTTCTEVGNGYWSPAPVSNVVDNASMARYSCNILSGHNSATTDSLASSLPTDCYNSCPVQNILDTQNNVIGTQTATSAKVYFSGTISAYDSTNQSVTTSGAYPVCTYDTPVCNPGYHANGNTCEADTYTVTYSCGAGTGTPSTTNTTATYNASYTLSGVDGCSKPGYSFTGWNDGTSATNSAAGTQFTWTFMTGKTFTAQWSPNLYVITLNDGDDAITHGSPATLYLQYGVGWFTDAAATNPITQLSQLPTRTGYEFLSYNFGGTAVIDVDGVIQNSTFTADDAELVANWGPGKIPCAAGTYYAGAGTACTTCEPGYYCEGGRFTTNTGTAAGLTLCPVGGTSDAGAIAITSCHSDLAYASTHGSGTQTCAYNEDQTAYIATAACTNKVISKCNAGYYFDAQSTTAEAPDCVPVGPNYYSPADIMDRIACPPTHPTAQGDTTATIDDCYNTCPLAANATEMNGLYYYNPNHAGYCSVKTCEAGYYLTGGVCTICPEGSFCNNNNITSCSTAGSGAFTTWSSSPLGSDSIEDCFSACTDRAVTYGHAYPVHATENYPTLCSFTGISDTGNPCDVAQLATGTCAEVACQSNFEMVNGVCTQCARDPNALVYEPTGNCIVSECKPGYHPNGYSCTSNVLDCHSTIPNSVVANKTWNSTAKSFDICRVETCVEGYHIASNACVPNEQTCAVPHGVGTQTWNATMNKWNACVATSCDAGYTNDDTEKNVLTEQCSECKNKYKANGDLAVSSYVRGCEIASCMYQGEKYALENGECELICTTRSDATGSRYWDDSTKRCVQSCSTGYLNW